MVKGFPFEVPPPLLCPCKESPLVRWGERCVTGIDNWPHDNVVAASLLKIRRKLSANLIRHGFCWRRYPESLCGWGLCESEPSAKVRMG